VRHERAADCISFGHDALDPFFAISTLDNVKIRHLGASESSKFMANFQCATNDWFNKPSQLFPIPLPLSVILNNIKCPHSAEIQNMQLSVHTQLKSRVFNKEHLQ